ncbi:protein KRI1 homolog [Amphiprion ocellaris]|uniref:Protein KRI1 homolog n=1 Tax=Amphiprion ocellaris TaxID=80972 RepID=A0A3Q1C1B0_AMPOC|nr:protein KRI1 homolog [Amphiprion ocellaris]
MSGKSELKINSQFAQKYDKYRQKEELQRLKDRYGDRDDDSDSESSESSSDDSEVELDPEVERDFYRTLSLLKKKDPKIYEKDAKFYTEEASTSDAKPSTSKKAVKPMYLKDYERKVILEKEGKYEDDDDSDDEEAARRRERAASPSYMQEQRELKESFRKFIQDSDDDDDAADEGGEGGGATQLLTRRIKTQEEKDKEEADYVDWLKGQAELEGPDEVKDMKYLRDYWNDPELDEKECFLRDYVLNKGYLDEDEDDERIPTYDEVVQDDVEDSEEEGESFLERQEDFERSYNFRFEEPDSQQVKTYPRNIATSVRSKDDRRKRKREEIKERKQKEKEQKQEQLKQLKNLKRNEIMEKLKMLQELTGNEQLAFSQADLDGDFDPKQHDQLMQKYFGDEYYGEEEGEKPQFEDDDELEEHWNWDTWTGEGREEEYGEEEEEYDADEPHCNDENFIMDADFDPSQQTASKKKKKKERKKMKKEDMPQMGKRKKKSHFAEVITKNKPVFDPQEKSFEQYLDEYYKLDYEDIIDDLPCRFRYRQVLANDFGLTTDEILNANDGELNRWSSLKKTCMFRSEKEEMSDLRNYKIKAQNERKKKEILSSVYSEEAKDLTEAKTKVGKKRRDRLKNAEKQGTGAEDDEVSTMESAEEMLGQSLQEAEDDTEEKDEEFLIPKKRIKQEEVPEISAEEAADQPDEVKNRTERPKWPKKNHKRSQGGSTGVTIGGREFSRQRLKAYGLNPKRLYFRQLGRQKRKAQERKEKQKNKE